MCLVNDPDTHMSSSWLLAIGNRCGYHKDETMLLPQEMISLEYFLDWIILIPQKNNVDSMNDRLLSLIFGEEQVFFSTDTVAQEAGANNEALDVNTFPPKFFHTLTASGLPLGELQLVRIEASHVMLVAACKKGVLQACLQILHKYHTTKRDRRLFTKNNESNRGGVKHREKLGAEGITGFGWSHTDKSNQSLVISSLGKDKRDD